MAVPCERSLCTHETVEQALVPVHVGNVEQRWCPDCVKEEFDLDYANYHQRQQSRFRYVNLQTVTAFLTGFILMLLISSVMVV